MTKINEQHEIMRRVEVELRHHEHAPLGPMAAAVVAYEVIRGELWSPSTTETATGAAQWPDWLLDQIAEVPLSLMDEIGRVDREAARESLRKILATAADVDAVLPAEGKRRDALEVIVARKLEGWMDAHSVTVLAASIIDALRAAVSSESEGTDVR